MRRISSFLAASTLFVGSLAGFGLASSVSGAAEAAPTFAYSIRWLDELGCELVKVDLATGAITDMSASSSSDACVQDLALAPDGTPWGVDEIEDYDGSSSVELVKFSATTGAVEDTVDVSLPSGEAWLGEGGIAFIGSTAYIQILADVCEAGSEVCLFTVNTATGVATQLGGSNITETDFLGLANCGGLVTVTNNYGPDYVSNNYTSVNSSTGIATFGADVPYWPYGYDCTGSFGYLLAEVDDSGQLVLSRFDQSNGAATGTPIEINADISSLALPPQQVPDTTTSTTAPSTTTTSTSTTVPPRNLSNTIQPRFAG